MPLISDNDAKLFLQMREEDESLRELDAQKIYCSYKAVFHHKNYNLYANISDSHNATITDIWNKIISTALSFKPPVFFNYEEVGEFLWCMRISHPDAQQEDILDLCSEYSHEMFSVAGQIHC
ncbi:MAG: hypothetical protein RLN62_04100 [Rickettsiales bacterium]